MNTQLADLRIENLDIAQEMKELAWIGRSDVQQNAPFTGTPTPLSAPMPEAALKSILTQDTLPVAAYRDTAAMADIFEQPGAAEQLIQIVFFPNQGTVSDADVAKRIQGTGRMETTAFAVAYLFEIETVVQNETIHLKDRIQKGDVLIRKTEGFAKRYFVQDTIPIVNIFKMYLQQVNQG